MWKHLTNVPMILANGADWYKSMGTADSAGVKIFSLSGRVRKPGNYELPFGTTFRELIYAHGGGVQDGTFCQSASCLQAHLLH